MQEISALKDTLSLSKGEGQKLKAQQVLLRYRSASLLNMCLLVAPVQLLSLRVWTYMYVQDVQAMEHWTRNQELYVRVFLTTPCTCTGTRRMALHHLLVDADTLSDLPCAADSTTPSPPRQSAWSRWDTGRESHPSPSKLPNLRCVLCPRTYLQEETRWHGTHRHSAGRRASAAKATHTLTHSCRYQISQCVFPPPSISLTTYHLTSSSHPAHTYIIPPHTYTSSHPFTGCRVSWTSGGLASSAGPERQRGGGSTRPASHSTDTVLLPLAHM